MPFCLPHFAAQWKKIPRKNSRQISPQDNRNHEKLTDELPQARREKKAALKNAQEALKGDIKIGFRSEIRTRYTDFAVKFALDTSILTALSKAI